MHIVNLLRLRFVTFIPIVQSRVWIGNWRSMIGNLGHPHQAFRLFCPDILRRDLVDIAIAFPYLAREIDYELSRCVVGSLQSIYCTSNTWPSTPICDVRLSVDFKSNGEKHSPQDLCRSIPIIFGFTLGEEGLRSCYRGSPLSRHGTYAQPTYTLNRTHQLTLKS